MAMSNNLGDRERDKFYEDAAGNTNVRTHGSLDRKEHKSAFGDAMFAEYTPIKQISAQYGILADTETFTATGGTVTASDNMFVLQTGTSVGGYGVARQHEPTVYKEGQGLMARFTALFDSTNATANSLQGAGLFNVQDSLFFGYRGTDFAIIYDSYGVQETRKLTITVAGNGNLTLTLNSVDYVIAITTGSVQHNAAEIEAWMTANQTAWNVQQINDTVIFQNASAAAAAGTYSISGASMSGTFSTIQTGVAKTEATYLQADWTNDTASWLDPSKGNVYMIKVSYLGFGPIRFFILNPTSGEFDLVHTISPLNSATKPSLSNKALKVGWVAASLGSTTNITVKGASAGSFIEGKLSTNGGTLAIANSNSSVSTSFVGVLTIKGRQVFGTKAMVGKIKPMRMEVSTDSTKEVQFKIVKDCTLSVETNYQYVDETNSAVIYDTGAHANPSDGTTVYIDQVGSASSHEAELSDLGLHLNLNETFTVFARVVSGAASDVTVSFIWKEEL